MSERVEGVAAPSAARDPEISTRCGDCLQPIGPDGSGHLSWCPFWGETQFPRLSDVRRDPSTGFGEAGE